MKKEEGDLRKLFKIFESQGTGYDWGIIASVIFLSSMGVLMVYSTSSVFALEKFGDSSYFLKRHAIYLSLGFAVMIILMKLNYSVLRGLVYPAYVIGLVILALVLITGVSKEMGGARRWINLGIWSFQPAEIAKFLLIFYLSYSLMKKKEKMDTFLIGFVSHLVIAGSYIILILLEPDFGMSTILLIVLFGMLFIGGVNMRYLAFSSFAAVISLVWAVMSEGYRMNRVTTFLNPWKDPLGSVIKPFSLLRHLDSAVAKGPASVIVPRSSYFFQRHTPI